MSLSRRQFAQLLATGALSSALSGSRNAEDAARAARALDEPARLDGEVLGYFLRSLSEYYRADKMLGPRRPLHHYDLRTLTEQSATCYLAAGRADVAVTILEDTIAATSSTLARDRGHLTSKLAVAITRTPSPTRHEQPASACKPSPSPTTPVRPASCANSARSTPSSPSAGPATRQAALSVMHSPHSFLLARSPG